jgi:hypothetical protein
MQGFLEVLSRVISVLSVVLLIAGFFMLIRQIKKTNRMSTASHMLSIVFSLVLLLFNLFVLKSAKTHWWFVFPLIVGAGFGFAWGTTTMLKLQDTHIIGKRSVLYIYFWLASLIFTQILAFFAKTSTVAIGLAGMFFSTGASLGTNGNIIYRMRKLAKSSSLPRDPSIKLTPFEELKETRQATFHRKKGSNGPLIPILQKSTVPPRKKSGHWAIKVLGVFFGFLLIVFILIRFVVPGIVFPLNIKIGSRELTLFIDDPISQLSEEESPELPDNNYHPEPEVENNLIFFDDFNSINQTAAALYNIEYMRYFNRDGFGVIESAVHPGLLPIIFPKMETADFIAEFDFLMPDALNDSSCGFLFRANGTTKEDLEKYYALFLFPKVNVLKIGMLIDDQISYSPVIEPTPAFFPTTEVNHIRIEVQGENLKVYLNGNFVTSMSEGSLLDAGYIGMFLYPSESLLGGDGDYVLFDNLVVYQN